MAAVHLRSYACLSAVKLKPPIQLVNSYKLTSANFEFLSVVRLFSFFGTLHMLHRLLLEIHRRRLALLEVRRRHGNLVIHYAFDHRVHDDALALDNSLLAHNAIRELRRMCNFSGAFIKLPLLFLELDIAKRPQVIVFSFQFVAHFLELVASEHLLRLHRAEARVADAARRHLWL